MVNTASANMILQSVVPDHLRGRLVSFHVMAFLGVAPLGHFASGWTAEHFGARVALAIGGMACLLGAPGSPRACSACAPCSSPSTRNTNEKAGGKPPAFHPA